LTLLFDDTSLQYISQIISSPLISAFKFKQVLAFTPNMIRGGVLPIQQPIYYLRSNTKNNSTATNSSIVPSFLIESGKTMDEIQNYMWSGQDQFGIDHDRGQNYPNKQVHYRWKYFGKVDISSPFKNTLYILDDGDIQDQSCQPFLDLSQCNQEFYCDAHSKVNRKFSQTNLNITSRGIISLGCSEGDDTFTQCGTCKYHGTQSNFDLIQNPVIQKMDAK